MEEKTLEIDLACDEIKNSVQSLSDPKELFSSGISNIALSWMQKKKKDEF